MRIITFVGVAVAAFGLGAMVAHQEGTAAAPKPLPPPPSPVVQVVTREVQIHVTPDACREYVELMDVVLGLSSDAILAATSFDVETLRSAVDAMKSVKRPAIRAKVACLNATY